MNNRESNVPSIGMIIAMFIIFYPLGYVLLFIRLNRKNLNRYTAVNEKNEPIESYDCGTGYVTFRNILIAISIIMGMGIFSETYESFTYHYTLDVKFIVTCILISVVCLTLAYRMTARLKKYQPYLNYLTAYGTDPIQDLARSLRVSSEQARKDLSDMIGSKIIKAGISDDDFVVLDSNPAKVPSSIRYEKKFIRCPYCGAPNALDPNKEQKCEYCDSVLN
ncbi:MAG: hypothetical protein IJM49_00845 [Firmicutes bacterium]|nr:hypothetical protein [Bacillota bacterium]